MTSTVPLTFCVPRAVILGWFETTAKRWADSATHLEAMALAVLEAPTAAPPAVPEEPARPAEPAEPARPAVRLVGGAPGQPAEEPADPALPPWMQGAARAEDEADKARAEAPEERRACCGPHPHGANIGTTDPPRFDPEDVANSYLLFADECRRRAFELQQMGLYMGAGDVIQLTEEQWTQCQRSMMGAPPTMPEPGEPAFNHYREEVPRARATVASLGEAGYAAYAASTGGKTFDGRDMPTWAQIVEKSPHVAAAWEAAAGGIAAAAVAKLRAKPRKPRQAHPRQLQVQRAR